MVGGIDGSVSNPFQMKYQEVRLRRAEFFEEPNTKVDGTIDQVDFSPLATMMSKRDVENVDREQASVAYGSDERGEPGESEFAVLASNLPDESGNSPELNRLFQKYDENGDGELSLAEFRNYLSENVFAPSAPPE